jgi:diguanylate cyclase (GGDEF)-like protein
MHMSFRTRLTLFFLLLVVLPVIALAIAALTVERHDGQRQLDARLSQAEEAAANLYARASGRGVTTAKQLQNDMQLATAVEDHDEAALRQRADDLQNENRLARVELRVPGVPPVATGDPDAIASVRRTLRAANGATAGQVIMYGTTPIDYARLVRDVTGLDVLLTRGGELVVSTLGRQPTGDLPQRGSADIGGVDYRMAGFTRRVGTDDVLGVRVLADQGERADLITGPTLLVVGLLTAFLFCALLFTLTAARSLQAQTERLLEAAQRLGGGDLTVQVPVEGNDEFAALGREFNSMARQLRSRMEELDVERSRLQETVRRVGESIGKGLDRDALLSIVVQTAVDGVGADAGRVLMRDDPEQEPAEAARAGDVSSYLQLLEAAEDAAIEDADTVEMDFEGASALARPMQAQDGEADVLGVISLARPGRAFSPREQELLTYLANQASISIENVDLHRTVQRQAVTDELTGLFNHRRFQEVMSAEVERTKRFGHDLGLIMLDLDNFKQVNDDHGHLQGDLVLREVARVLRESSREIDEPARYGGEEMAVALPQTGLQGAYEFAERVRRRIEDLELPLLDGSGTLRVTASFGAAALPRSSDIDKDALVAAADAALYRAKRAGKNRTVKAE